LQQVAPARAAARISWSLMRLQTQMIMLAR
jgi:hypothetical protein